MDIYKGRYECYRGVRHYLSIYKKIDDFAQPNWSTPPPQHEYLLSASKSGSLCAMAL
jgi:hypothetical protein